MEEKELQDLLAQVQEASRKASNEANKAAFETLQKQIEDLKNEANKEMATKEKITKEITRLAGELKALQENGNTQFKSVEDQVKDAIIHNLDKIKSIYNQKAGVLEIEIKEVGNITTETGINTSPPNITGTQQAPLSNVNLRAANILVLTNNINTNLAAYPYTEAKPKDGDAAFTAEGVPKTQIDLKWETNYAKPVKVAAWERLTQEAIEDVAGLQSVATDFLRKKHDLRKMRGILFGDGNVPNPKGATVYGRTFVAGAMAGKVATPNFMDAVNAAITDIYTTHNFQDETPYMASIVLVNPVDFFIYLVSAKTADGVPLYPTAALFNSVNIGGVTIYPEEMIPAGKIFVADMSKYNTTNYSPYRVQIGWVNDDFIKNQFVILGESRFHAFVKKLDEKAFIYDDIDTILDLIAAPTT